LKRLCFEVNSEGKIIECFSYSDKEIEAAEEEGRLIVDFVWESSLYKPKFDFELNQWIESMTQEEIELMKQEAEKTQIESEVLKEEINEAKIKLEQNEKQMQGLSADLQGFMDFYFSGGA
jgi:hypothetical protein